MAERRRKSADGGCATAKSKASSRTPGTNCTEGHLVPPHAPSLPAALRRRGATLSCYAAAGTEGAYCAEEGGNGDGRVG
eukprot:1564062-Rhodomonas_salina.1